MTAQFAYDLPFGAQVLPDGRVRFRLWAPAQDELALVLEDDGAVLPMAPAGLGWFELETDRARHGSRYRYRLADGFAVPDPASRCQDCDAHDASVVVDGAAYTWKTDDWPGRPWEEAVLYELHVGSFSPAGSFDGVRRRLDHLAALGVTAVELMPVADFPGARNWGYDGVLPFAPDRAYGRPEDLKALVDAAHDRGLMMVLDVVYNHFGPDGNYLHLYAPDFFTDRHHTPWGAAIDFARRPVREFFIHNALYWLQEYRFDGLRLDAVHAIRDDSDPHILYELAQWVRSRVTDRPVHLVLENDANEARYLDRDADGRPRHYEAQWNDDIHHAYHVALTSEADGYYRDYTPRTMENLARGLAAGYIYQGEASAFRDGAPRGEGSRHLPPTAFVNFLQNHDQVGNRAFGERLTTLAGPEALRAAQVMLLLAPQVPLLFMGEEWGETRPFPFFCDFHDQLADAVREGRRAEFARFPKFSDPAARTEIPDPNAPATFEAARLRWPEDPERTALVRDLLALRQAEIVPRLAGTGPNSGEVLAVNDRATAVTWLLGDGSTLHLRANLGDGEATGLPPLPDAGRVLFEVGAGASEAARTGRLPVHAAVWFLEPRRETS